MIKTQKTLKLFVNIIILIALINNCLNASALVLADSHIRDTSFSTQYGAGTKAEELTSSSELNLTGKIILLVSKIKTILGSVKLNSETTTLISARSETVTTTPTNQAFTTAEEALNKALSQYLQEIAIGEYYKISELQKGEVFAYAIAEKIDPSSNQHIPEESFVPLLAYREKSGTGWYGVAPKIIPDQEFNDLLMSFPSGLLDENMKAFLYLSNPVDIKTLNFSGYKLPWGYQQSSVLTKKDNCTVNNCLGTGHELQLDFDILGGNIRGDVYASKPGKVVFVKESQSVEHNLSDCSFNDWRQANMVVIQHSASEYSWYVHLQYNSVPVTIGQTVGFGTKIGVEGSTGYSCGIHLHYMTSTGHGNWTDPADPNIAPWATGIIATDFDEVSWSNLTVGHSYKSGNNGSSPPLVTLNLGSPLRDRQITIELRPTTSPSPLLSWTTTADANGNISNYALTGASLNTPYYLLVKPQGWLRKEMQVSLASGLNSFNFQDYFNFQSCWNGTGGSCAGDIGGNIINGIIEGNNKIDIVDIGVVIDDYGLNGPNQRADINRDGVVNIVDIGIIIDGYGRVGYGGETKLASSATTSGLTATATSQLTLSVAQPNLTATAPVSPATVGDIVTLNLDYDTAALAMAGVSAVIDYDECVLQPLTDQITSSGIFPNTGTISNPGTLEYQAHRSVGGATVTGTGRVASIPFRYIAGVPSSTTVSLRFRPGSAYFSTMDQADLHQPFLSAVNKLVLYPTGNPQRPTRSANISSPLTGSVINQNFVLIQAQASDACNGLHQVIFYVFYDGQWHPVGTDTNGADGWQVYWNASPVSDQVIKIKAFAGDFAGNGVLTTINDNIRLDRQSPSVISITRLDPNPSIVGSLRFRVTFSETVTGVTPADFNLTASGIAGAGVTSVFGSGTARTVTVSTGTGFGTLRLNVLDYDRIKDVAGNKLGGTGIGNGNFFSGQKYTLDRNNLFGSNAAVDGWVLETGENTNLGGTLKATTTLVMGDDALNRQYRSLLYFNTIGLPDNATIVKVTLKIRKASVIGTDPFTTHGALLADIQKGFFGTSAALQALDFQALASKSSAGAFTPVSGAPGWYQLVLNPTNFPYVNKTGPTQFRLRFTLDDNNDRGADYATFYAAEAAATLRPVLVVEYTLP